MEVIILLAIFLFSGLVILWRFWPADDSTETPEDAVEESTEPTFMSSPMNEHVGETHSPTEWDDISRQDRADAGLLPPVDEDANQRRKDGTQKAHMDDLTESHRQIYGKLRDAEEEEKLASRGEHAL